MSEEGILQKVIAPCLRCNNEVEGFLIPDGRFICPTCDPAAVYERWNRTWDNYERLYQKQQRRALKPARPVQFSLKSAILAMLIAGVVVGFMVWNYKLRHAVTPDPVSNRQLPSATAAILVWNDTGRMLDVSIESTPSAKHRNSAMNLESGSSTVYLLNFGQDYTILSLYYRRSEALSSQKLDLRSLINQAGTWQIKFLSDGSITTELKIPETFMQVCISVRNRTGKMTNVHIKSDPLLAEGNDRHPFELDPNYETWFWIDTAQSYKSLDLIYQIAGEQERTITLPSLLSVGLEYKYELSADGPTPLQVIPDTAIEMRINAVKDRKK